jgi:hypothetical protein
MLSHIVVMISKKILLEALRTSNHVKDMCKIFQIQVKTHTRKREILDYQQSRTRSKSMAVRQFVF